MACANDGSCPQCNGSHEHQWGEVIFTMAGGYVGCRCTTCDAERCPIAHSSDARGFVQCGLRAAHVDPHAFGDKWVPAR